jgi:anti-sigma factor RsiW
MKTGQPCRRWREAIHLRVCGALEGQEAARVEAHVDCCAECRRYAEELRAATTGLRWLGSRDVEPRPGFRARWTRAVEEAARPSSFGDTVGALVACWRGLLLRNLRPTLGVASLWILALLFRLSAPEVPPPTPTTTARSPVEIYRVLGGREQLLAGQLGRQFPVPVTRTRPLTHPRSDRLPPQPSARWEHEPVVNLAVGELFPNPIKHGNSATLLPV